VKHEEPVASIMMPFASSAEAVNFLKGGVAVELVAKLS